MDPQLLLLLESAIPPGRLFGMDDQTLIQVAANAFSVLILGLILTKVLYRPVRDFMGRRIERIRNQLAEAETNMAAANELKSQYERKVKDIELERGSILDEARKQANERRNQLLDEAKAEIHELKDRANRDIAAEQERVKDEVHRAIVDISADMAAKLIEATIDKSAHDKLFADAMSELESTVFRPLEQTV